MAWQWSLQPLFAKLQRRPPSRLRGRRRLRTLRRKCLQLLLSPFSSEPPDSFSSYFFPELAALLSQRFHIFRCYYLNLRQLSGIQREEVVQQRQTHQSVALQGLEVPVFHQLQSDVFSMAAENVGNYCGDCVVLRQNRDFGVLDCVAIAVKRHRQAAVFPYEFEGFHVGYAVTHVHNILQRQTESSCDGFNGFRFLMPTNCGHFSEDSSDIHG